MTQKDKEKFAKMLYLFSNGSTVIRSALVRKYTEEVVDEVIAKGYIAEIRKDKYGDPVYAITETGKEVWK